MKRPAGVSVIAVLLWLVGVVNVISGINAMDELSAVWGGLQLLIGIAAIVCGIGCWRLSTWARTGTIVLMGLNAVGLIATWIRYSDRIIVSRVVIPLIINIVVVIYLLQPNIKAAFGTKAAA